MPESFDLESLNELAHKSVKETLADQVRAVDARPGDLLRPESAKEFNVDWLLVLSTREEPARCLLLPHDSTHWVGTGDMGLFDDEDTCRGVVHCDFEVWLPQTALDDASRLGNLEPAELQRVQSYWSSLPGSRRRTSSRRAVDEDPDYREWIDESVRPARNALAGYFGESTSANDNPPQAAPILLSSTFQRLATAAALLLFAIGAFQLDRRLDFMSDQLKLQQVELEDARSEIEESTDHLARLLADRVDLDFLTKNPVVRWIGESRGGEVIAVPAHSKAIVLGAPCPEGGERASYRLTLSQEEAMVWQAPDLLPDIDGNVWGTLQVPTIRAEKYLLELEQMNDGIYKVVEAIEVSFLLENLEG